MEIQEYLIGFMEVVADDPRIGPHHISLFLAILHFYQQQGAINPVMVFARDLRKMAKIGSQRNYFARMKDLKMYGYIK